MRVNIRKGREPGNEANLLQMGVISPASLVGGFYANLVLNHWKNHNERKYPVQHTQSHDRKDKG